MSRPRGIDSTQIVREEGFTFRTESIGGGGFVVTNAYDGKYDFFGFRQTPARGALASLDETSSAPSDDQTADR